MQNDQDAWALVKSIPVGRCWGSHAPSWVSRGVHVSCNLCCPIHRGSARGEGVCPQSHWWVVHLNAIALAPGGGMRCVHQGDVMHGREVCIAHLCTMLMPWLHWPGDLANTYQAGNGPSSPGIMPEQQGCP